MQKKILVTTSFFALAVVIYSYFTFGLSNIHSDNAVELLAINCIMENKDLLPASWVYCNGDINLMRIQVFIFIPYLIFNDWSFARECGALLATLLSCVSIYFIGKKLLKNDFALLAIPMYLLFIGGVISRDVSMYSGMYTSIMFYTNILMLLFFKIYKSAYRDGYKQKIIYIILMITLLVGGIRWVAELTLPMFMTIFVMQCIEWIRNGYINVVKYLKRATLLSLFVVIPSIIGMRIYYYAKDKCYFFVNSQDQLSFVTGIKQIIENFVVVTENMYKCLGYTADVSIISILGIRNLIVIVVGTLCFIVVPILQLLKIKTEDETSNFFVIYCYMHNLVLISASVLMGKLIEYHAVSIVFVWMLISCRYIYVYWMGEKTHFKEIIAIVFAVFCVIEAIAMAANSSGWKDRYNRQRVVVQSLEEHGLTKGYGGFWTAYNNELYSNGELEIGAIRFGDDYFEVYSCLCDNNKFLDDSTQTFIIFTEEEYAQYSETALVLFGPTEQDWVIENVPVYNHYTYQWEDTNIYVWSWAYDIATRLNNGVLDGYLDISELIFNWMGTKTEDSIIMSEGGVVNGPFNTIYAGNYLVTINGDNIDSITYDIKSDTNSDALEYNEVSRTETAIVLNLNVKNSVDDFYFEIENNTSEIITFTGIDVVKQ